MPKVKKSNRVISVDKSRLNSYLERGYDQVDEKGKIVKHATGGKTVSIGQYNNVLKQIQDLKEENAVYVKEIERLESELEKSKQPPKQPQQNKKQ